MRQKWRGKSERRKASEEESSNVHYPPLIRMIGALLPGEEGKKATLLHTVENSFSFKFALAIDLTRNRSSVERAIGLKGIQPSMRWGGGEGERLACLKIIIINS